MTHPDPAPADPARPDPADGSARGFGVATASFVIVSSMIGVGVLTTSGLTVARVGSNQVMLGLWVAGGLIALCGALSLAEVSAAVPRSGGEYAIFHAVYGPGPAFLAGWVSFLFGFAAPVAMAGSGAAGYLLAPMAGWVRPDGSARPLLATALIAAITAAHARGRGSSVRLQATVSLLELALLAAFVAAGCWRGRGNLANLRDGALAGPGAWAASLFSLVYVAYSYTGWNAASYLAGEVRDPGRTLPRAIGVGTLGVVVLYLGLNVVYALALPALEVVALARSGGDPAVEPIAHLAADRLFGPAWSRALSGAIGLILVATLSALLLTGPRVLVAMADDRLVPARLARTWPRSGAPASASILLAGAGVALLWTGSFHAIVVYSGVGLSVTATLAVAAVVVLRRREPDRPRPFRVPGYPATPGLFIAANLALLGAVFVTEPRVSALSLASLGAGEGVRRLLSQGSGTQGRPRRNEADGHPAAPDSTRNRNEPNGLPPAPPDRT